MPYTLTENDEIIVVETTGKIAREERASIMKQLREVPAAQVAVIDHQKAQLEATLEDATNFSTAIVDLAANSAYATFCVIASEQNRAIIDMSVVAARRQGVRISVCESRREAWACVLTDLSQTDLNSPSRSINEIN